MARQDEKESVKPLKKGAQKNTRRAPAREKGASTKKFTVAPGYRIGGYDGKICNGGDTIELTKKEAEYFNGMGALTLGLPDFDDEKTPDKAADGDKTSGSGNSSSGGSSSNKAVSEDGDKKDRGRKAAL